jgi:hypothetical protein
MPRSEKPFTPRKRRLSTNARRALEMLADGFATERIMLDHGFPSRLLSGLVSTGLAMPYRAPLKVDDKTIEVTYITITAAGRRALTEWSTRSLITKSRSVGLDRLRLDYRQRHSAAR